MTFIPLSQAAEMVGPGIRPATLHTYREKGMLRCVKIGKEWRTTAAKQNEPPFRRVKSENIR